MSRARPARTRRRERAPRARRGFGARRWRAAAATAAAAALLGAALWAAVPFDPRLLDPPPASTQWLDARGGLLRVDLADDVDSRPVPLSRMGEWAPRAIVAAEDGRFHRHPGIDAAAIGRAVLQNLAARRVVSGASTLSTQLVRLIRPAPRTPKTKVIEAVLALKLERRRDKAWILEQYLNRAPFGSNLVGIEAAARAWFDKPAADLTLGEAALLAGLPQSPSRLRPDRHPERARRRQRYVLDRMVACGFIAPAARDAALERPTPLRAGRRPFRAPHFCEWARDAAPGGGVRRTTLDPAVQAAAERILREASARLPARGAAIVVQSVPDGAILALAGSPDYGGPDAGQVNAAAARRSSGSTLKPFLYALAFDRGLCAPSTVFRDEPAVYAGYEPRNFDESFRGPVTARAALAGSLNIPAIRLLEALGPARALETLRAAGLRTLDRPASHYGLGLAVGGGEVRLTDLVNAYAALARGGDARPPRRLLDEPPAPGRAVFSPEAAFLALDILADDERAAAWAGHGGDGAMPRAAWKTGTSPGQRDAWAVACNPDYAVGVWIGNPDGTPSESLVGTTAAVPPVAAAFRWLYRDRAAPAFAPPPGVIRARGPDGAGAAGARAWDWAIAAVSPPPGRPFAAAAGGARLDGAAAAPPRIVSPADGERFRRLPDAAGAVQELRLSAAGAGGPLYWFANGQPVGAAAAGDDVYWPLRRGDWTLACSDAAGRSARVRISVE